MPTILAMYDHTELILSWALPKTYVYVMAALYLCTLAFADDTAEGGSSLSLSIPFRSGKT